MIRESAGRIYFDSDRREIVGPDFSIKHVGRLSHAPPDDIFLFTSTKLKFYFLAERFIGVVEKPGTTESFIDSKIYVVIEIGHRYGSDPDAMTRGQIPDAEMPGLLSRIEKALFFDQSVFYSEPPVAVRVNLERDGPGGPRRRFVWR